MSPIIAATLQNVALYMLKLAGKRAYTIGAEETALVFNAAHATIGVANDNITSDTAVSSTSLVTLVWALAARQVALDDSGSTDLYLATDIVTRGKPIEHVGKLMMEGFNAALQTGKRSLDQTDRMDQAA